MKYLFQKKIAEYQKYDQLNQLKFFDFDFEGVKKREVGKVEQTLTQIKAKNEFMNPRLDKRSFKEKKKEEVWNKRLDLSKKLRIKRIEHTGEVNALDYLSCEVNKDTFINHNDVYTDKAIKVGDKLPLAY